MILPTTTTAAAVATGPRRVVCVRAYPRRARPLQYSAPPSATTAELQLPLSSSARMHARAGDDHPEAATINLLVSDGFPPPISRRRATLRNGSGGRRRRHIDDRRFEISDPPVRFVPLQIVPNSIIVESELSSPNTPNGPNHKVTLRYSVWPKRTISGS